MLQQLFFNWFFPSNNKIYGIIQIINSYFKDKTPYEEGDEKIALFTGGGPAAGKGRFSSNIDEFYNRLLILKKYNESWRLDRITTCLDGEGYVQRQVIDNEIIEVIITEKEYNHNGITEKEFRSRMGK